MPESQFFPSTQVIRSTATITGLSKANPGVVTAVDHGLADGDTVYIAGVGGMIEVNNLAYTVTVLTADTFSIGVNTTGYTTYTSGGAAFRRMGSLVGYNAGDAEGMIPLLQSGGKFHEDRIPAIAGSGGGLQKEGATKSLATFASVEWASLSAVVRLMRLSFGNVSGGPGLHQPYFEIGAGSYSASGYFGGAGHFNTSPVSSAATTRGNLIRTTTGADVVMQGRIEFTLIGSHVWQMDGQIQFHVPGAAVTNIGSFGYVKTLGSALDRVRLVTSAGAFDAGTASLFTDQSTG